MKWQKIRLISVLQPVSSVLHLWRRSFWTLLPLPSMPYLPLNSLAKHWCAILYLCYIRDLWLGYSILANCLLYHCLLYVYCMPGGYFSKSITLKGWRYKHRKRFNFRCIITLYTVHCIHSVQKYNFYRYIIKLA